MPIALPADPIPPARPRRVIAPSSSEPYARWLGLELPAIGVARLTVRPELLNGAGMLLGPVVFSLVDYAMGDVVARSLAQEQFGVTLNLNVNFLATTDSGVVTCTAVLDRAGRVVAGASAQVHAEDGRLLATAIGTFAVRELRRRSRPPGG